MSEPTILREASFDPKVKSYWIWQPVIWLSLTVVMIPFAVLYAIIARFFIGRYIANLSCVLTQRTLDIKKGIFNKTESTIPLEKITDLQLFQGPVMRYFGLFGFKVETAGQTSGGAGGSLVNMVGIVDTKAFRKAVLEQRDRLHDRELGGGRPSASSAADGEDGATAGAGLAVLEEIRDTLGRIEGHLKQTSGGGSGDGPGL